MFSSIGSNPDEDSTNTQSGITGDNDAKTRKGIEYQGLDIVNTNPLFIDNKEVYFRGFKSLSDEDKARVLMGFLLENQDPSLSNLDNLNPNILVEKNNIHKDNKMFKLKLYGLTALIAIIGITAVAIIGTFMYLSLDKGVLDENGVLSGILSTLTEAIKILFSDPTSSPL